MSIRWMDGRKVKKDRRSLLMKMGYSIYDRVRQKLAEDNAWHCYYCHEKVFLVPNDKEDLATIDHRVPLSRGGVWKRYNLTCACRGCNEDKDNMTDEEYRFYRHLITGNNQNMSDDWDKMSETERSAFVLDKIMRGESKIIYARTGPNGFYYVTVVPKDYRPIMESLDKKKATMA